MGIGLRYKPHYHIELHTGITSQAQISSVNPRGKDLKNRAMSADLWATNPEIYQYPPATKEQAEKKKYKEKEKLDSNSYRKESTGFSC